MSAGVFKITEIPAGTSPDDGTGEVFMWTSDWTAPDGLTAARAAPRGDWRIPGQQRQVRTDYPGGVNPSRQILGPSQKAFTWIGVWDDRFNGKGFAVAEMRRFENMCRRGNPVQVEFQEQSFRGVITEWEWTYKRDWQIGYSFTFDPDNRTDVEATTSTAPPGDPGTAVEDLQIIAVKTAGVHADKPAYAIGGTNGAGLISSVSSGLAKVSKGINDVAGLLDIKTGILKPIGDLRAMGTQFRRIKGDCAEVAAKLGTAKATLAMGVRSAKAMLDFETWGRSTARLMRVAAKTAESAAKDVIRRDVGNPKGIYRPRKGESIYSVSRACYGSPFNGRAIRLANPQYKSIRFAGTETLVIPERGQS